MKITISYILLFLINTVTYAAGDIVAPEFGKKLKEQGISLSYEISSVDKLNELTSKKMKELKLTVKSKSSTASDIEDAKEDLAFIKYANKKFQSALQSDIETEIYDSYNLLMRVLYSVAVRPFEGRKLKLKEILKIFKRLKIKIPLPDDVNSPIGLAQAELEASNLIDPNNVNRYMSPEDLAKLTPLEISELDISKKHSFWLTKEAKNERSNDPWSEIESWAQNQIQKKLNKKRLPYVYDIHKAKKVLFFKGIKDSGTSPKISTNDAFKAKWKVKWGIEIHSDPVVNDIYLKAGGKYADLTYNMMRNDYVLLLNGSGEDSCENVRSVKMFKQCFKKSIYKFKVDHYLYRSGTLTSKNVDQILKALPENPNYTKKSLVGREYIKFKESLLEYKGKSFLNSVGTSSYSQFGAENDRTRRGLVIFNHFIRNIDAKEQNNKIMMVEDYDKQAKQMLETQSDLGVSLANPLPGGNINGMNINNSFVKRKKDSISFNQWVIYEPKAWDQATFSDSLWMVKKIVTLTKEDFSKSIERLKWPKFMKELLLYKLLGRRNKLAEVFNVRHLLPEGESDLIAPTVEFSLKTKKDREYASKELGLSVSIIEKQLEEYELINRRGVSRHVDKLIHKGKLRRCDTTVLYGLLEKNLYPTGLTRRVSRLARFKELRDCAYIPRRRLR